MTIWMLPPPDLKNAPGWAILIILAVDFGIVIGLGFLYVRFYL